MNLSLSIAAFSYYNHQDVLLTGVSKAKLANIFS